MGAYILRRILLMIPTLLGIMAISFAVIQFAPGGPVEQVIAKLTNQGGDSSDRLGGGGGGDTMGAGANFDAAGGANSKYRGAQGLDPEFIAKLEKQFGFDKPPLERFGMMLWNYARFDFGDSYFRDISVVDLILEKMPVSISIGLWVTLLSYLISIPLGYVIVSVRLLEKAIYPVIVFFQLVPKIAIAPLFVVWFGFGLFPKVLLTFLLCFFPTLVASMTGFRALDERVLYLTRSMGASAWQTFRYVRVPAALTYIFSGLKVSAVFAATGAIVGEFVGANAGLGYLLLRGTSFLDMPLIFACLVALSIVGILFSYIVDGLEVLLMPWQRKG